MDGRLKRAGPLAALLALGLLAYWDSFDVPFLFDDFLTIQKNAGVRFGDYLMPNVFGTRPLLYLTFALDYRLHGLSVWGYHAVNLGLHVFNALLVFYLAQHIYQHFLNENIDLFAFFSAAFFLLHPIQTEAVTYISSRSELLSTFFYLLAFLVFIKTPVRHIGFWLSLPIGFLGLLGLLSKETAITLPAALLLYDFLFLSDARLRPMVSSRWRFYLPLFLAGSIAIYKLWTVVLRGAIGAIDSLPPWLYFLTELRVLLRYVQLVLCPVRLNLLYDLRLSTGLDASSIAAGLVLLALLGLGWYLRRRSPIAAFAVFWFFLTLLPTSSFIPIPDVIFEHRLYLPLAGLCLLFPVCLQLFGGLIDGLWKGVAESENRQNG